MSFIAQKFNSIREDTYWTMFNTMMHGGQWYMTGNIYERRIMSLPSMCGGRLIEIKPTALNISDDQVRARELPHVEANTGPLACGESGLMVIHACLPNGCYSEVFRMSVQQWCDKLMKDRPGFEAEVSFPPNTRVDTPCDVPNHRWYVALLSVANVGMHDDESGGQPDECDCEECGEPVYQCDEYYCEECDWYTRPYAQDPPFEDYEMGLELDSCENMRERFNADELLENAESWRVRDEENQYYQWKWQDEPISDRVDSLIHASTIVKDGVLPDFWGDEFTRMLAARVLRAPVLVSSNLAESPYMTPDLMGFILRMSSTLYDRGIGVLHNSICATNPNERNHYIDGIVLYPKNRSEIRRYALNR